MSNLLRMMLYPLMAPTDGEGFDASGAAAAVASAADDDAIDTSTAPEGYTQEEWEALSENERLALLEPEEDAESLRAIAGDDDQGGDAGKGDGKGADAGAANGGDGAAADVDDDGAGETFQATYRATLPDDFDAQVQANKDATKALTDAFKAGDIEVDEYEAKREELTAKRDELTALRIKSEISAETSAQAAEQRWAWECERFYEQPENEIYKNPIRLAAHDAAVRNLVSDEALKAHPERAKWSGAKILREADAMVRAEMGGSTATQPKPETDAEKARKAVAEANAKRRPDLKAVPKTLAGLPAAENTDAGDGGDEFADIDKLQGIEYENAIARLSPAALERYQRA